MTLPDERPLIVLPSLAATLGLEEALLYQLLADWAQMHDAVEDSGFRWHLIDRNKILSLTPFWDGPKLNSLIQNLAEQGVIRVGSALGDNYRNCRIALEPPSPAANTVPAATSRQVPQQQDLPVGRTLIHPDWTPDKNSVDYLQRFHGIDPSFIEHHVEEFIAYWRARGEVRSSWNSTFSQHVLRRWEKHSQTQREQAGRQRMDRDWQPEDDAVRILVRGGMPEDFVRECVAEFILKWRERGQADNNWNKRFVDHTREQWAWARNELGGNTMPTAMQRDWQPDPAVYDILRMAEIDAKFALQLLPEFVLYWTDSKQMQRSWNSKFLQHVKYRWAQSHQLDRGYGKTGHASGKDAKNTGDIFHRLTDRSWADGLSPDGQQ